MGSRVRLRPADERDLVWLSRILTDREAIGEHNWAGVDRQPAEVLVDLERSFAEDGMINAEEGTLLVELVESGAAAPHRLDPIAIGYVTWRTEQWGPQQESRCLAFGIALLPRFRGRGLGTLAQQQLVDFLFTATATHRIQSDTSVDNPAEQRSLKKVGLVEEGRVRDAEFRNGRYYDHLLFSILRPEWEQMRSASSPAEAD